MRPLSVCILALPAALFVAPIARLATQAPGASAADSSVMRPGVRVRVWLPDSSRLVGTLVSASPDTLVVRLAAGGLFSSGGLFGRTRRVGRASLVRLDVSRGRRLSAGRVVGGAALGAAAVVGMMAIMDGRSGTSCGASGSLCVRTEVAYGRAALVGASAGALLGLLKMGDRWERLADGARLGLNPILPGVRERAGAGLGVSLQLPFGSS